MNWSLGLISRALLMSLAMLVLASAGNAEPVNVNGATREDYGRLVFKWISPVGHDLSVSKDNFTVKFTRSIDADYRRSLRILKQYVASATPTADGKGVTYTLTSDYEVFSYDSGSAVIVEIVQKEGAATPVVVNQTNGVTKPPEEKINYKKIGVRTGVHKKYTRIVFDWPKKVKYGLDNKNGVVSIAFASPAEMDVNKIQSRPPVLIGDIRSQSLPQSVLVTLAIPKDAKIKHFYSGSKIVLDVLRPDKNITPVTLPSAIKKPVEEAPAETKTAEVSQPKPVEGSKSTTPEVAPLPTEEKIAEEKTTEKNPVKEKTASEKIADNQVAPLPEKGPEKPTEVKSTPTKLKPGNKEEIIVENQQSIEKVETITSSKISETANSAYPVIEVTSTTKPENVGAAGIRFNWQEAVGAAIFRRAGVLWVVFDKPGKVDVGALKVLGKKSIRSVTQLPNDRGTVLRMLTGSGMNPSIKREGLAWILVFKLQDLAAQTNIKSSAQLTSPVGPRLFLTVPKPGRAIGVNDPGVGDNLVIIPTIPLGLGVAETHIYPQVRVLPSAQGIVIEPRIDNIRVRSRSQGVELTNQNFVFAPIINKKQVVVHEKGELSRILHLEDMGLAHGNEFLERRQELELVIATAKREEKSSEARLELARFYFANRFAPEALSVLEQISMLDPKMLNNPEFRLLRGGSNLFMRRFDLAFKDLKHKSLYYNDEAIFWLAVARAHTESPGKAGIKFRQLVEIPNLYPDGLRIPLQLLMAEAAIEIGDIEGGSNLVSDLLESEANPLQKRHLQLVEGMLLEQEGEVDDAVAVWEKILTNSFDPIVARATLARMELLLKEERMSNQEAIDELEKIRFSWRGDEFEFNLLQRMGGLYLEEGRYRKGLTALREAATYFREHEKAPEVTQKLSNAFAFLYLEGGADTMLPVTAIALYDEFRELTPAGRQGDEMVRRLADRLAGVDLLDDAAALLEGQIEFRLKGAEKSQIGSHLALIQLIARQYEKSIKALDDTETADLPESLVDHRRHLRARALMGLNKSAEALVLLEDDKTPDAELLRAEIHWSDGKWGKASQALQIVLLASGAKPRKPLSDQQVNNVLNLAVSMSLSGNDRGLLRLQADYDVAMLQSDVAEAYRLVVTPIQFGLISPESVSKRVKMAENFQDFLRQYQTKLKNNKQSSGITPSLPSS